MGTEEFVIRVFPRRTKWTPNDKLAFVGDPPLWLPREQPVRVSCTFTWDIEESERLKKAWSQYYSDVQVGGPAYDDKGGEFVPGRFVKEGVTITSRGCTKNCDWCVVPKREGWIRELSIKPGWNVLDNNLLACSQKHIQNVFVMLQKQSKGIVFSGGLDAELLKPWHANLLQSITLKEAWFSCDYPGGMLNLQKVAKLLPNIPPQKKRCYVLIGFNGETIKQAEKRLCDVYNLGFWPFAMLYRSIDTLKRESNWSKDWLKLQRTWCRPAAFKAECARRNL